jgi:hypothetical protein
LTQASLSIDRRMEMHNFCKTRIGRDARIGVSFALMPHGVCPANFLLKSNKFHCRRARIGLAMRRQRIKGFLTSLPL